MVNPQNRKAPIQTTDEKKGCNEKRGMSPNSHSDGLRGWPNNAIQADALKHARR
jgi:hypothetical protein